jgi:hypothetical protein
MCFFPTYELYEYGQMSGQPFYCEMAINVKNALTQGVLHLPRRVGVQRRRGAGRAVLSYTFTGRNRAHQEYMRNYPWRGGNACVEPVLITAQVLQSSLRLYYSI